MLGARLVRTDHSGVRVAKIVEVEAYLGEDRASHAHRGPTKRNSTMFGPAGHAYVYLVYGMYECLNVVTEPEGTAAAVLIRAVVPVAGDQLMREARAAWLERQEERRLRRQEGGSDSRRTGRLSRREPADLPADRLAGGPGLVCIALSVGREFDGLDVCDAASSLQLRVAPEGEQPVRIVAGPRIGIGYAPEPWLSMPLRFRAVDGRAR